MGQHYFCRATLHKTKMASKFRKHLNGKRVICLGIPDDYEFTEPLTTGNHVKPQMNRTAHPIDVLSARARFTSCGYFSNLVSGWGEAFKVYRHILVPRRARKGVAVHGVGELVQRDSPAVHRAIGLLIVKTVAVG
jgi:hypothetical protein